jgi:hypothetical protein
MDFVFAAEAVGQAGGTDGYWKLALILAAIGILGLLSRWRKARVPPQAPAKEMRSRDQHPERYRDAADRALVELVEVGREINAQVDTKIRFLNRLIKEADDRISKLEKLSAQVESIAETPGVVRQEQTAKAARPSGSRRFFSELQARVVDLHDSGRSVTDISKATGLSTVEIELALQNARNSER